MATYLIYGYGDQAIQYEDTTYDLTKEKGGTRTVINMPTVGVGETWNDAVPIILRQSSILFDLASLAGLNIGSATLRLTGRGTATDAITKAFHFGTTTPDFIAYSALSGYAEASATFDTPVNVDQTLTVLNTGSLVCGSVNGVALLHNSFVTNTPATVGRSYVNTSLAAGTDKDPLLTVETSASVALTGTITSSTTEANIAAGGKTIILTVTDGTWVSA